MADSEDCSTEFPALKVSDIEGLAKSLSISTAGKLRRDLCQEIDAKVKELGSAINFETQGIAEGQVPTFNQRRGFTTIQIKFKYFKNPATVKAIEYLYIESAGKAKSGMKKVYWKGFPNHPTLEPAADVDAKLQQQRLEMEATKKQEELQRKQEEAQKKAPSEAEAKRVADEAEAKRVADEAEAKRLADEAEAKRLADEAAAAKAKRLADEAEAKRLADEAEVKRVADENKAKRLADEAEAKRVADEAKRVADEALRLAAEEKTKQADADEKKKVAEEQRKAVEEAAATAEAKRLSEAAASAEAKRLSEAAASAEAKSLSKAAAAAAAVVRKRERETLPIEIAKRLKSGADPSASIPTMLAMQREPTATGVSAGGAKSEPTTVKAPTWRTASTSATVTALSSSLGDASVTSMLTPPVTTEREQLDAHVHPCAVLNVDRCCLLNQEPPCLKYVSNEMDTATYGAILASKKLGTGMYGEVYKTEKNFAVKCFITPTETPGDIAARDLREMVILRNLVHPNVVQAKQAAIGAVSVDLASCSALLVMPFYDQTLHDAPAQADGAGTAKEHFRATLMYQLVRAVAFMHSRGVLHRDIKPRNVLWNSASNQIALADFGLAQGLVIENNRYDNKIATLYYRAPELFLKTTRYGAAVDLWALGATWLEVIGWDKLRPRFFDDQVRDNYNMLSAIFQVFGTPPSRESVFPDASEETWVAFKEMRKQQQAHRPPASAPSMYRELVQTRRISQDEFEVLMRLLKVNPKERKSAQSALAQRFFNAVRATVESQFRANPLPPEALSTCGSVLLAMEVPPVGDYLDGNNARKKEILTMFEWLNRVNAREKHRSSVWVFAVSVFHRFAAAKLKQDPAGQTFFKTLYLAGAACYATAAKLDADGNWSQDIAPSRLAHQILANKIAGVTAADVVAMHRDLYLTLDMDLDRPHALTFLERLDFNRAMHRDTYNSIASYLMTLYRTNFDRCVQNRGSQLAAQAVAAIADNKAVPCLQQIRNVFAELFPDIAGGDARVSPQAEEVRAERETRGGEILREHLRCLTQKGYGLDSAKRIGVGATSNVYCVSQSCDSVVKIIDLNLRQVSGGSYDIDDFENEIALHKLASSLKIAPHFIDAFTCPHANSGKRYGYIVMEKWNAITEPTLNDNVKAQLENVLQIMRQNDLVHGDLRVLNIVVKNSQVALIDWGKAFRPSQMSAEALRKHVQLLKESLGIVEKISDPFDIDAIMLRKLV